MIALTKEIEIEGEKIPVLTELESRSLKIPRGNFSPEERLDMEKHVVYSFEIIKSMKWPYELENVPQYIINHHERLDGSGYPDGRSGDDLDTIDRLIAITDMYDALTATDRPYKKAFPSSLALKIIGEDVADKKLDQDIYNLIVNHIEEINDYVKENVGKPLAY